MIYRAIATLLAVCALVGGAVTFLGWLLGWQPLTDWDADGIAMLANTSIATTVSGASLLLLLLLPFDGVAARRRALTVGARIFAAVAALVGGLTLTQHLFGWNLGIDTLVIDPRWGERAAAAPGRMGPPASFTFLLLGVGLLLATVHRAPARRAASILALLATLPPIVAWTAYFYGADPLYSLPQFTGIARQTAAILAGLAVGLVLAIEEHGIAALLRRDDAAGTLVRRLLPISIALLLITGWLEDVGVDRGLYSGAMGNAVLTVVRVVMFTALLLWTARAVIQQIERRRSVEAALGESEHRFETLADNISQLAWIADARGDIQWFNRRWYEYTGTTFEQMRRAGWEVVHPDHRERVAERLQRSWDTGEPWEDVFPIRGADGDYGWFLSHALPIRDERGHVMRWFGTNTDISDQRAAEEALRHANRMKDEFLATLSHELRTPMSAILGWSQLLRRSTSGTGQIPQGLEVIERNARLQSRIIEDLLDMNRILTGRVRLEVRTIDLGDIVRAAVDAVRPAASARDVAVHTAGDDGLDDVRGDPARLQQIFYNLLMNAVKFTPRSGRVEVRCERRGSHVTIRVTDTGIGIRPDFLPHVFDRFRQQDASTTRTYGGLGLGLGIVKHLVELHGGTVEAASEGEGRGAMFTVRLPVALAIRPLPRGIDELRAAAPAVGPASAGDRPAGERSELLEGITALVVDDEPDARELLRSLLPQHGAEVLVAASADEALERFRERRPDVILCDIGMPVVDGYGLIRTIRDLPESLGGRTPAIALTAFARSEDRTAAMRAGFQMHVAKPVETDELVAGIRAVVGR